MFNDLGEKLKELLGLENEPVAIKWSIKEPLNIEKECEKSNFCIKLEKAMQGEVFYATAEEESCFGGARHTGLRDKCEFPPEMQCGSFLVSMGNYKNVPAAVRSMRHNMNLDPNLFQAVIFAPLAKAEFEPDLIFILCKSIQGMEILHANSYDSGTQGLGADSAPICSSMAAIPYLTGKVTYGFADVGSRNFMKNIKPEDIMVTIPASEFERIVSNLEEMRTKPMFKKE
jgi:Uncharacterized protein conserved in archaea